MSTDLETRLRRIEDRQEINDLSLLYFLVMDERQLDDLPRIFTEDAHLGSDDGVFAANGLDEIRTTYQGRFDALGPTFHYSHGLIAQLDEDDPDRATGVLVGHAEVVRNGEPMLVGLRYRDVYRRTENGWRIADRVMGYFYYTPAAKYVEVMNSDDRNLAYAEPGPADWPSALTGGDLGWLRALTGR